MALLLLTVVRGDLMRNWRASLPPDAPNQFLVNVLPDQVAAKARLGGVGSESYAYGARPPRRSERREVDTTSC
jgi:predicted lysophospholipase L1 biosynthesis ABC-type transport system permease subunit